MPSTITLTPDQRRQFEEDGVIRIPRAIPPDDVEAMAARIWAALTRQLGAVRERPETWDHASRPQLKQMRFPAVLSPDVRAVLDTVFGGRPSRISGAFEPRPLGVIFPTPRRWNVPTLHWHLDRLESDRGRPIGVADGPWLGAIRLFAYLESVQPRGGGTFYVAGSHRAVNRLAAEMRSASDRIASARLVEKLKRQSAWFAALCSKGEEDEGRVSRFMDEGGDFWGMPVRVAEMTGEPGEVILWHPNLLHTFSPANNAGRPRIAVSATLDVEGDERAAQG